MQIILPLCLGSNAKKCPNFRLKAEIDHVKHGLFIV